MTAAGPLAGVKVIEMAGIGPAPFCGMLLADMGADVLRLDRTEAGDLGIGQAPKYDLLGRGKRSVALDLKSSAAVKTTLKLVARADILIEGFRPGVMERLGLGPDVCLQHNPKLIFGRMTGWGQDGPLASAVGHDINYIALSGALNAIGRAGEAPVPPLNLVGDFGGGALYLAFGVLCALLDARTSGKGQVVDAAMIDGSASLMTMMYGLRAMGGWSDMRGENLLDTGAPWYDVYETKDGKYMAVGAIEKRFYQELLRRLGLENEPLPAQHDRKGWPQLRARFREIFRTRTREEWRQTLEGSDACVAPVLSMEEAQQHPHAKARQTFLTLDGVTQPAPAPRFSRTPAEIRSAPPKRGADQESALTDWGISPTELDILRSAGAIT